MPQHDLDHSPKRDPVDEHSSVSVSQVDVADGPEVDVVDDPVHDVQEDHESPNRHDPVSHRRPLFFSSSTHQSLRSAKVARCRR